jgi:hypothetical protein
MPHRLMLKPSPSRSCVVCWTSVFPTTYPASASRLARPLHDRYWPVSNLETSARNMECFGDLSIRNDVMLSSIEVIGEGVVFSVCIPSHIHLVGTIG